MISSSDFPHLTSENHRITSAADVGYVSDGLATHVPAAVSDAAARMATTEKR